MLLRLHTWKIKRPSITQPLKQRKDLLSHCPWSVCCAREAGKECTDTGNGGEKKRISEINEPLRDSEWRRRRGLFRDRMASKWFHKVACWFIQENKQGGAGG